MRTEDASQVLHDGYQSTHVTISGVVFHAEILYAMTAVTHSRRAVVTRCDVPVTGRGRLEGREMLRTPHCLESRLTDGGKVVCLTHQPRCTPQKGKRNVVHE
jgi:hypothetical protein